MYYYLTKEIKRRFISELKTIFQNYPGLHKLKVSDKFPTDERPQYGVIVKNVSAGTMPLSADNFIGTVKSHCFLASLKGKKSLLLDWVREETVLITRKVTQEELTSQVVFQNQVFTLANDPLQGFGNLKPADSPKQVTVYVDQKKVDVIAISGRTITLLHAPLPGSVVTVDYYTRYLEAAGLYYFEVTGKNEVTVDPLLDYNTVIIPEATGAETTFVLPFPIYNKTLDLIENDKNLLVEGIHYTLVGETITWLPNPSDPLSGQTLRPGVAYRAVYRYQAPSMGTFQISPQVEILKGVTTAFSPWIEIGDKQVVIITNEREDAAQEFGGNFDVSLSMEVYSRDPIQRELITDLLAVKIFGEFKPIFDAIGLMIVGVNINGEMEDMYDENTDTPYFMTGIDVQLTTDWRIYAPLLPKIKYLQLDLEVVASLTDMKAAFVPKIESIR